jgi:hypothetical protein
MTLAKLLRRAENNAFAASGAAATGRKAQTL